MVRNKFEAESVKGSVNPLKNNYMGVKSTTN